jgi:REP element-mobilizing transposase RayT
MDQSRTFQRWRRNLPHIQRGRALYFITFSTHQRRGLKPAARDLVFREIQQLSPSIFELFQLSVMPDHVHLLCMLGLNSLDVVTQRIKGRTARFVNQLERTTGAKVWQTESWDRIVRDRDELLEICEYIRFNPVAAGLVKKSEDYPWYFARKGFG